MEISQASIKDCPVETKTKLTDDLFRLLQVREKNHAMAKDWLLFLTASKFNKLTPGEIYLAFQMAMAREILDHKGNEIDLLPELSNNATGKVLTAYMKYKSEDSVYGNAKDKLKLMLSTELEPTEEQKLSIRERFLLEVFHTLEAVNNKAWRKQNPDKPFFSLDAWLLYEDVQDLLSISDNVKRRLYRKQEAKYFKELEREVAASGNRVYQKQILEITQQQAAKGKKNAVVQNRCKSIVVSNYLKKYITDFETFKKQIKKDYDVK